jgi:ribosomal protein S18 acetylase RimI-like enzyme
VEELRADQWSVWRDLRLKALTDAPDSFGATLAVDSARTDAEWNVPTVFGEHRFVVYVDDALAGMCFVKAGPGTAHLYAMWVDPQFRGLGCGSALVERAIATALEDGSDSMELRVASHNVAAVQLYLRHGFIGTGEITPLRPGSSIGTEGMRLTLSS